MTTALEKIDFHGDSLWAARDADGSGVLVAVKPIVERLGLDWPSQYSRIKRDELLSEGIVVMTIPSPGGQQETTALPLDLIPGFLFGISVERIADAEVKARVLAYKRECHVVLYAHFFGPRQSAVLPDPTEHWDWGMIGEKVKAAREVRLTHGRKAGQVFWKEVGLPMPWVEETPDRPLISNGMGFVRSFLADRTAEQAGGRVQASVLFSTYREWARETGAPDMTLRSFGETITALGIKKATSNNVYYLGLRILHRLEAEG